MLCIKTVVHIGHTTQVVDSVSGWSRVKRKLNLEGLWSICRVTALCVYSSFRNSNPQSLVTLFLVSVECPCLYSWYHFCIPLSNLVQNITLYISKDPYGWGRARCLGYKQASVVSNKLASHQSIIRQPKFKLAINITQATTTPTHDLFNSN